MWASLFSTGIVCTLYTTVVKPFIFTNAKTEQIFFYRQQYLITITEEIIRRDENKTSYT